jgi:aminopeptidase N
MRSFILLLVLALSTNYCKSQSIQPTDDACIEKCHHQSATSRVAQVTYFQYGTMNKYDLKYLKLDLNATAGSRVISGTALTRSVVLQPLDSFVTELKDNMIVDSVYINGVKKVFTRSGDHVFVSLSPSLPTGSVVEALFYYNGTAGSGGVFAGTVGSNGLTYTATLSESYQAREWFPIKQFLKDKIDSADIWVTTAPPYKVGSNGLLQGIDPMPGGKQRYRWKTIHPMNYYLPSISIGNYMEYLNYAKPAAMAPDSILIQHYLVNNITYFNSVKTNLDKTPPFVEKLSELFGLYPFSDEKYGHAHANIGGGMEHQTMSTMAGFGSTLIAHELGHQWWGDHVTCATWNDIWLNEGFASYCEYLLIEKTPLLFPTTNALTYMQNVHNNVLSSATGSVRVPDASVFDEGRIFSGRLSYNKGSAIVHTLRFEMQDDNLFFNTLKNFQIEFADSVASAADFKRVAEQTSGKDFTRFFNQWYTGEGYPTHNIVYYRPNADSLLILVNQTVSAPSITPFFGGLLELKINSETGDTTVLVNLHNNNQVFGFRTRKIPTGIVIDPNNWVLNQSGTVTNAIVVPVRFSSFTGKPGKNCSYELKWQTAEEGQISSYDIEMSEDGISFTVAGTQVVNTTNNYVYTHNSGNGKKRYFRIKGKDSDGNAQYSKTILVDPACDADFKIVISPNPAVSNLQVRLNVPQAGDVVFKLIHADGRIVYRSQVFFQAGTNNWQWNGLKNLPKGVYVLQAIFAGKEIITQSLIKD